MGVTVGIDLGTTFSAIARVNSDGKPAILPNSSGEPTTPSVVAMLDDGRVVFGQEAKDSQLMGDANSASFYKRNMGEANYVEILQGMEFDATDLSSIFLRNMITDVSEANGIDITAAVVTVPAYFKAAQREATKEALRRTGVTALGVLNEPSAAAYAYGLMGGETEQTVLIYDLGGGTFDVTVAKISGDKISVLASDGDHRLGGREWDAALTELLLEGLCEAENTDRDDLTLSLADINMLAVLSEKTKRELTSRQRVQTRVMVGGYSQTISVSREEFEDATSRLLSITTDLCERVLSEIAMSWRDIDGVILIGGSTRMPQVRSYLTKQIGREPYGGVNPDEAVALGAAVYANQRASASSINGDSAPAFVLGASAPRLVDCTAHAMGMIAESKDRSEYENSIIIPKNAAIPASKAKSYMLRVPSWRQGTLEVYVLQGAERNVFDNDVVGKYVVEDIESEGQAESLVEITYSYDENAIIHVTARQPHHNKDLLVKRVELEEDLSRFERAPKDNDPTEPEVIPMRVMISIDTSGSMCGTGFRAASEAVNDFLNTVEGGPVQIGVLLCADRSKIAVPMGSSHADIRMATQASTLDGGSLGWGNAGDPIIAYESWWKGQKHDAQDVIIVLTDGVWDSRACSSAISASTRLKDEGVIIIGIGVASADLAFLRKISTSDNYAGLFDFATLGETFSSIGRSIATGSSIVF